MYTQIDLLLCDCFIEFANDFLPKSWTPSVGILIAALTLLLHWENTASPGEYFIILFLLVYISACSRSTFSEMGVKSLTTLSRQTVEVWLWRNHKLSWPPALCGTHCRNLFTDGTTVYRRNLFHSLWASDCHEYRRKCCSLLQFTTIHRLWKDCSLKLESLENQNTWKPFKWFHSVFLNLILFWFILFFFSDERGLLAGCRVFLYETLSVPTASNPRTVESKWKKWLWFLSVFALSWEYINSVRSSVQDEI